MNAARKSALLRSTARNNGSDPLSLPSIFSLPQLTGLKEDEDEPVEEDILADLNLYDTYESLYDIRPRRQGYELGGDAAGSLSDTGGFVAEECWEKSVRAAVAGLWTVPLGWQEGWSGEQEKMNARVEEDIVMDVA